MNREPLLMRSGHTLDEFFDGVRYRLKRRTGFMESAQALPYRTFGNRTEFYVKGRVLKDRGSREILATDGIWRNLIGSYRRFNSIEIPGAKVRLEFGGSSLEVETDDEGYFECHFAVSPQAISPEPWQEIKVTLLSPQSRSGEFHSAPGHVLVPPVSAQFGIISDIDDTVLITEARSVLRMFASTFFKNAHTRLPFPGVAALYQALQSGSGPAGFNPIFYVSSGPWNLYDLLRDFFEANQIPAGPLCLQDFGFDRAKFLKTSHLAHKEKAIKKILQMYPDLPFILLGDSGQKDPEIYLSILKELPARIKAIYIRDVAPGNRSSEVQKLFEEARKHGGELLLVANTFEAAKHSFEKGWITREALNRVAKEMNLPEDPAIHDFAQEAEKKLSLSEPLAPPL